MTEKRNVRSNDLAMSIRDEESRPQTNWLNHQHCWMLQKYVLEWFNDGVATSIQGKDTPDNVYKRMREGWNHVKQKRVKGQSCFRRLIMVSGQVVLR